MNEIEPDYNYQFTTSGRGYGKTFFQNRIKQAYNNGKQDGFREKDDLIKYLESRISYIQQLINGKNEKVKPYGEERHLYQNSLDNYVEILKIVKSGKYE